MKPSRTTVTGRRTLGLGLGISLSLGLSCGLGLLTLVTYSSDQASSVSDNSTVQTIVQNTKSDVQDEWRSPTLTKIPAQSGASQSVPSHSSDSFITYDVAASAHHAKITQEPSVKGQPDHKPGAFHSLQSKTVPSAKQVSPASSAVSSTMPTMIEAMTVANEELEQTLAQVIPDLVTCPYASATIEDAQKTSHEHRYAYHAVDLNNDHQNELIVHVMGPMTCGTGGCTTLVLQEAPNSNTSGYDVVTRMSVVNFPMIVSDRTSSGWRDLLVTVSGGGAQPGYRQLQFDGQSYPTNPSLERKVTSEQKQPNGQVLMVDEDTEAIAPVITATDCDAS